MVADCGSYISCNEHADNSNDHGEDLSNKYNFGSLLFITVIALSTSRIFRVRMDKPDYLNFLYIFIFVNYSQSA